MNREYATVRILAALLTRECESLDDETCDIMIANSVTLTNKLFIEIAKRNKDDEYEDEDEIDITSFSKLLFAQLDHWLDIQQKGEEGMPLWNHILILQKAEPYFRKHSTTILKQLMIDNYQEELNLYISKGVLTAPD